MKIKWYWMIYLLSMIICFAKWFSSGMILIFSVVALIILLIEQRNDKEITIYNVYTNDDDEFEKPKKNNTTK
jgi:hypothetical protein